MLKEDVVKLMSSSKTEEEWNANCDKVKDAHNGDYPNYWYETFLVSGLMSKITSNFS
jgi:hypothetical protein